MPIHPTAIVDSRAEVHPSVVIGPFVVIEGRVSIDAGTRILARACIFGVTAIGRDNVIHPGAVIGGDPQHLGYGGEPTSLRIGDRNIFRENVEVHRAWKEGGATEIGDDNYLMSHAHVGHDCRLGRRIILATGATLGGHVEVGDQVFVSGNCVVHQFVRIGRLALLRGLSRTSRDVPPFCIMDFTHTVRGLNRVGLRRAGFSTGRIRELQRAFAHLFARPRNLRLAVDELDTGPCSPEVRELLDFIRASKRGVCTGRRRGGSDSQAEG